MSICLLKRTIRIITSVFISICLIFVFSTVAIAEEYSVSEIEAKLSIPDDWYTFSKHSTKDAYPYLDEGTFDACMSTFTTNPQVCLYAVSLETSSEILVVYNKNTANNGINFNSYDELAETEAIQKLLEGEVFESISAKNGFKSFERINKIAVITKPFEVGVELSAKQEMMRYRVADIYKEKLAKLYKD